MRSFRMKRPSAPMAVAFVALLAAMTGSAVALPGKNTVDAGDLKASSVGASEIKSNAVRSGEIKNNAVRGTDILESSLGKVPSAGAADAAATANTAKAAETAGNALALGGTSADTIKSALAKTVNYSVTLGDNETRPLAANGSLTVYASCNIDEGGDDIARIIVNTSANDAVLGGWFVTDPDFDPAENPGILYELSDTTGDVTVDSFSTGGWAGAADGASVRVIAPAAVLNGFGKDNTCHLSGTIGTS